MNNQMLAHFRDAMKEHQDEYILIGGNACALVFEQEDVPFRPTEDLDIVLVIEDFSEAFAKTLDSYISEGGYLGKNYKTDDDKSRGNVYRFTLPQGHKNRGTFPAEIELFSRAPDEFVPFPGAHTIPIETGIGTSNFSAILFDDDYYAFLRENITKIQGVNVPTHQCLTMLKCCAWIGNKELFANGVITEDRIGDVHKHAFDISRLLGLFEEDEVTLLPERIIQDLATTLALLNDPKELKVLQAYIGEDAYNALPTPLEDAPELLELFYSVAK